MRVGLAMLPLLSFVVACSVASEPPPPPAEGVTTPPASSTTPTPSPTVIPTAPPTPSTPVPPAGGRPAGWGPSACPTAVSPGFGVGQSLADVPVRDCDTGAPASLADACGAKATWVFAAHTHCPTCRATAGFTDEVAAANPAVAVVHLVYDDSGTSCAKWRDAYKLAGLTNVFVYDDPGGAAFEKIRASSYTAPSVFLDKGRLITFKEHGLGKEDVLDQIGAALGK